MVFIRYKYLFGPVARTNGGQGAGGERTETGGGRGPEDTPAGARATRTPLTYPASWTSPAARSSGPGWTRSCR